MDYHANKKWLAMTKKKNEETLNEMKELAARRQYDLDLKNEEEQKNNFYKIASNLHHLISTKEIPGVYNTPYLPPELKPQVLILAGSNGGYNLQSNTLGIGMGGESGTQIPQ